MFSSLKIRNFRVYWFGMLFSLVGTWIQYVAQSWLVFKLAFYWQSTNFSKFPDSSPNEREAEYLVAKRQLGTHQVSTALVGTGANIVVALIGVAVGKWIRLS